MKPPIVLVGIGEMGGVFARGLLRAGHPVYPVTRDTDIEEVAQAVPNPALVLVAVGEADLQPVLERLPAAWRDCLGLLQNEILPADWQRHGIADPTVISVWFEKKPGQEAKVIIPSPAYGPRAELLAAALEGIGIPTRILTNREDLLFELVLKNLYILTSNIAGLEAGGTVGALWADHRALANAVAGEVLDIQQALCGTRFDREAMIHGMLAAFDGDPQHKCMGRTAPARLARAVEHADRLGLEVPTLRSLRGRHPARV